VKKLVFITDSPLNQTLAYDYCLPALAETGWEITVAAVGASDGARLGVTPYRCATIDLPERGAMSRVRRERALAGRLMAAARNATVVYVHGQTMGLRAALLLRGPWRPKRLVFHTSDYYCPHTYPFYSSLEGCLSRRADLYISNEYHRAYMARDRYRIKSPILVVPPNLPRAWPIPPRSESLRVTMSGGTDDAFVLMQHGGFSALRRTPELLLALARLPGNFRLVMTGCDGPPELALQLGIAERILCLPHLAFGHMLQYTVNADAGVLLYANNDFGNFFQGPGRFTEYVACGLPLLATNHTGLQSLVKTYDLGATVDSASPEGIAAGIRELAENPSAEHSPAAIRCQFEEHFALELWTPRIVEAFERLLDESPARLGQPPAFPWMPNP